MPTYSQAPVDSYLAFLEEITEYEEKSIEEISTQAATINDEEIAELPSYLSSPDQSDHENDLSEEPSINYVIAFRGDAQYYTHYSTPFEIVKYIHTSHTQNLSTL